MLTIENYAIVAEVGNLQFKYRGLYPNPFAEGTSLYLTEQKEHMRTGQPRTTVEP